MGIILWIIFGALAGWIASKIMGRDSSMGALANIVVGIIGALVAGFLVTPLIGGAPITSGAFDIRSLIASFIGAVLLLGVINLFRRGRVR